MVNKWHLVQSFSQKNGLYLKMASGHADENVCYDVFGGVCENVLPDPLGFLVVLEEMGPENASYICLLEVVGCQAFSNHPKELDAGELEMAFLVLQSEADLIPSYHQGPHLISVGSILASAVVYYNPRLFHYHQSWNDERPHMHDASLFQSHTQQKQNHVTHQLQYLSPVASFSPSHIYP